ncbi:MAG TPA: VTT domain-containing protein [Vicinamibacterales bacterium]|nr:VTT domain-containing protein [Vicinamibacterales bacterium]
MTLASAGATAAERAASRRRDPIVEAGRNCWRVDRAQRFYCVQDAADYFLLVRQALLAAQHSVFILSWDITGTIDLAPGRDLNDGAPQQLDALIAFVARRRPSLRIFILTWDYGLLYTLERDPFSRIRFKWRMPRNVKFGFDDRHPFGASHHQKVIVVDDELAFCGGIDLTGHRWDTSAHRPDEPERKTPLGKVYGPYHEVQAMVDGAAAASLGMLARDRWRLLGATRLPRPTSQPSELWPSSVRPDLTDVDVAISRTVPGSETQPAIRECEALFFDAIARARRSIFIENQYFTHADLARALAARLEERDGPEVIVAVPQECDGWLERNTIAIFRNDAVRLMIAADRYKRLRVVCPMAAPGVPTFVHSKVMIVDDVFVRIGSANCARRSMGMDTECDLAVEGESDEVRAGIAHIRDRLLGEHLAMPVEEVAPAIERAGSIAALIDARAHESHTLVRLEMAEPPTEVSSTVQTVVDPDEPIGFGAAVDSLVPPVDAVSERDPLRTWILPMALVIGAAMVAWQSTGSLLPSELRTVRETVGTPIRDAGAIATGIGLFVIGGVSMIPIELLAILSGVAFGALSGSAVAFSGALVAAAIAYLLGRVFGAATAARWMSRRSYRSARQMGRQGLAGMVVLRLASLASNASVGMLAGAGRVSFGTYLLGTAIGLAPVTVVLAGFGALLGRTIGQPSIANGLVTIGAGLALIALAFAVRTLLLIRQFAPTLSRHRERAEFG